MLDDLPKLWLRKVLAFGCDYGFYPYEYDRITDRLKLKKESKLKLYRMHKYIQIIMMLFSTSRWLQAYIMGDFPLLQKILNTVWAMAYILTVICFKQFDFRRHQILEFTNHVLRYIMRDFGRDNYGVKDPVFQESERKYCKRMSQVVMFGLLMLVVNPSVHVQLVDANPCTPHFISSLVHHECDPSIPLTHKLPFMAVENYLCTVIFMLWSFNWAIIYCAMAWVVIELRRMIERMRVDIAPSVLSYRYAEVICVLMNDAFFLYLATFPTLLFAIVSVLLFGVIRIWHYDPGSNLMFPLCGVRCAYEAITPLAVAGTINDKNKEAMVRWKQHLIQPASRKYLRKIQMSCRSVRCTASSLYTFENSIVLCCTNNCMQLTLNMFLTFE